MLKLLTAANKHHKAYGFDSPMKQKDFNHSLHCIKKYVLKTHQLHPSPPHSAGFGMIGTASEPLLKDPFRLGWEQKRQDCEYKEPLTSCLLGLLILKPFFMSIVVTKAHFVSELIDFSRFWIQLIFYVDLFNL